MRAETATQMAINSSRFNNPACQTRSAFERNLNAKPISRSPRTTFTEFNHPPDEGKEFSQPGNAEKSMKGRASAKEKPNMIEAGPPYPPVAAPANAVPTRGPVQEKETMARVAAMKKIPMIPPLSEALSALLASAEGKVISKAPKKEIPKITSKAKRKILKIGSVEIVFRTSTPKTAVNRSPNPVYIKIIKKP